MPTAHGPWFERRAEWTGAISRGRAALAVGADRIGFAAPAYNLLLRTTPWHEDAAAAGHWRIEIVPRDNPLAGFELATQIDINPISPTRAAQQLRFELTFLYCPPAKMTLGEATINKVALASRVCRGRRRDSGAAIFCRLERLVRMDVLGGIAVGSRVRPCRPHRETSPSAAAHIRLHTDDCRREKFSRQEFPS